MNNYVAQGDGFPGDNEFLMLIQSIIGEVSQLASLGGTNYILKGCEVVGGNVANGWMVLDGEVLPFEGAALGTEVTIIETIQNADYLEDVDNNGVGDSKPTYFFRKAVFGNTGVATYNWADIDKSPLEELKRRLPPIGCPLPYTGNLGDIPEGWELFAPMAGMFVVGYDPNDTDYDGIGETGGAKEVTLSVNEMPAHNHTGSTNSAGNHSHSTTGYTKNQQSVNDGNGSVVADSVGNSPNTGNAGTHSHSITLNNRGGGSGHENRPPYYTMAWIHYVGV